MPALARLLITSSLVFSLVACADSPPPPKQAEADPVAQAEGEPDGEASPAQPPVKAKAKNAKKAKKRKGHTYDGSEYEVVRDKSELDSIDKMTLKLRKKQPIYFLGLPMRQIPTDNWLMSELLYEVKPDYVVEAGTLYGGSAVYYAALMEFVNPDAKILTVDINEEQIKKEATEHPLWAERVKFYKGSSTAPEVHDQLKAEIGEGKAVFVTIDTLHAPNHVRDELNLFSELVSVGSYMILQDTYYKGLPEVLDQFLAEHPNWERVEKLDDRFIFTKYRGGFLRKES
jgi:cephalosporin hydroxylase